MVKIYFLSNEKLSLIKQKLFDMFFRYIFIGNLGFQNLDQALLGKKKIAVKLDYRKKMMRSKPGSCRFVTHTAEKVV